MDPVSVISGAQAIGRRFRFYVGVQVASVLAPGIAVIVGSVLVVSVFRNQASGATAGALARNLSGATAILAVLVLLAAGYVVGYVLRELCFKLLGQIERIPRFRGQSAGTVYDQVSADFPPGLIHQCFALHPVLDRAYKRHLNLEAPSTAAPRMAGGGHIVSDEFVSFTYAKLWIRNYAPGYSIDSLEAEINILVSAIAPSVLVGLAIIGYAHAAWWSVAVGAACVVILWYVIVNSVLRLRRTEKEHSIRNLLLDYAMRQAALEYPAASGDEDDQSE